MSGGATAGRTNWPQTNSRFLLPRDGDLYRYELGWAYSLPDGLRLFISVLFFLGLLWRELRDLQSLAAGTIRDDGSRDRICLHYVVRSFIAAGGNFGVGVLVSRMETLGKPVALTAIGFGIGLFVIPFAVETQGRVLPD